MSDRPLEGKKIAVLVDTEYIPGEIEAYKKRFADLGATLHIMSRLWDQLSQTFVSDVDEPASTLAATQAKLQTMDVSIDIMDERRVRPENYDAVLMSANYTSVRLKYFEAPKDQDGHSLPISPEMARTAPAVQFFAAAMRNPKIVKGALCHGLEILTPVPELLAGRRVICIQNVLANVTNAGAIYVPKLADPQARTPECPSPGVVVDGDLVTGDSWHVVNDYIDAIATQIVNRRCQHADPHSARPSPFSPAELKPRRRHVLIVLSEYGYWGEELVGPVETFDAAGYSIEFATPHGKRPKALPPSLDPGYVDPALARPVTSPIVASKAVALDCSARLDSPNNLSTWVPERPYWSHPQYIRALEAFNSALKQLDNDVERQFDALLIVGGSGPVVDLANNQQVHDLILSFYRLGKPIAAECYGITCLAFARDINDRQSILSGKHVTGHCLEYDYKHGWGFLGFEMGAPPYPLEYILRDATAPNGHFIGNYGKDTSVVVDYPFITGRSTSDGYLTGEKVVEVLEMALKRWGW